MKRIFIASILLLPLITVASTTVFNTDLFVGMKSPDVLSLQKVLNTDPATTVSLSGDGSMGNETDYFWLKTKDAVMRFQAKYASEILTPAGLTSPTGYVGLLTRAKLNSLSAKSIITAPSTTPKATSTIIYASSLGPISTSTGSNSSKKVTITDIYPPNITDGGQITISGTGFTASNTVMLSVTSPDKYTGIVSQSGGTRIDITIATGMGDNLNANIAKIDSRVREEVIQKLVIGFRKSNGQEASNARSLLVPATVSVKNENGTSAEKQIMINILKL